MKHLLSILILFLSMLSASAQKLDFNVVSFGLDEFSTAAQRGSQYAATDGNGDLYSIIKVKDVDGQGVPDGFMFDFGLPNTLKVEPHDDEVWVWVQRNAKQVTIRHKDYRTIDKYDLGTTIEAGRVYEMVVTMDRVERIVTKTVKKQMLQFTVKPTDASATVRVKGPAAADYELWGAVDAQGNANRYLPFGDYDYVITADDYDASYGRITLSNASETHVENVTLTPNFGYLEVLDEHGIRGAEVFVDGKRVGTVPYADGSHRLSPGVHRLELVKGDLYRPYVSEFTVEKGKSTRVAPRLEADFANVQLSVEGGATISIDGEKRGSGSWTGALKAGEHIVVCSLPNHRDSQQSVIVEAGRDVKKQLSAPTPITGTLVVSSSPLGATIRIDGRECGTTPKAFPELLIGSHEVELSLEDIEPEVRSVTLTEGAEVTVEMQLQLQQIKQLSKEQLSKEQSKASPAKSEVLTFTVNDVSFNMILVEHDSFVMGSMNGDADEQPVHSVFISKDYWMGDTEVTQALWKAVMGQTLTDITTANGWSTYGVGDDYPMYDVSWDDCMKFIKKLNKLTDQDFRMPTEAEWEYAARGGKKSKGYKYSGSNNIGDVAWYDGNSDSSSHPVATKQPNELGLYDMSGNVREWCSDKYSSYSGTLVTDPAGAKFGKDCVVRGGSWLNNSANCRTSFRGYYAHSNQYYGLGLRLVLCPSK